MKIFNGKSILITGGGYRNIHLMSRLEDRLKLKFLNEKWLFRQNSKLIRENFKDNSYTKQISDKIKSESEITKKEILKHRVTEISHDLKKTWLKRDLTEKRQTDIQDPTGNGSFIGERETIWEL